MDYYRKRDPKRVYHVEFVVRAFLGTYPNFRRDRSGYPGARIPDLGFGDGRNLPLLADKGSEKEVRRSTAWTQSI